ncbi:MAG: LytTR family DNA-binding domain-containing protein [Tidjanibacter sp.]|nr:LytTR family DNA-binding domain-containing protein [Tidjanibacter sp.]
MKNQDLPKFLFDRRYLLYTVLFVTLFSILFMVIYAPFSDTSWMGFDSSTKLLFSTGFYLVAVTLLLLSKLALTEVQRKVLFTSTRYILWVMAEFVLIASIYNLFTALYHHAAGGEFVNHAWWRSLYCVAAILVVPYTIATLYAAYRSKAEELDIERYENLNQRRAEALSHPTNHLINLNDYNGNTKLTLDSDTLYYVESQDNYVKIYYESEGKIHNYMLRCSTKTLESALAGTSLIRCHRSFIVNVAKIKVVKSDRGATYIELKHQGMRHLPVSKSYAAQLSEALAVATA